MMTEREDLKAEQAVRNFEQEIDCWIELGASDRETALQWMVQDETFRNWLDVEHWVRKQGILFTDYGRLLVERLCGMVKF